ncbi:MAG: hypothetical protein JSW27_24675 [Phycisphaerales bacterium]|nr:MAG: hypothetical protein JSW27_24675 [Phycisphaerales bacterium]
MKAAITIISGIMTLSLVAQDDRAEQLTIPLSRPDEPGIFIVHHHKGSINVVGYEGTSVVVRASQRYGSDAARPVIDLGAAERDNHVVLSVSPRHRTIDLDIMVPTRFSLQLKNDDSGTIRVERVSGEMEVSNLNGDIHLAEVVGSALLDTVDGNITAQFRRVTPRAPMAFTSLEGNVDVTFPGDVRALARIRADHGPVTNEFATMRETATASEAEAQRASWTYANLNGGGPEFRLWSFFGRIHIRRAENGPNGPATVTIPEK